MKKTLYILLMVTLTTVTFAQESTKTKTDTTKTVNKIDGKNEIRLNLLNGVLGIPEISYERLFNDNSGAGLSVLVGIDDVDYKLGFIPYYRIYFGNSKKSSGFFIEANAAVMQLKDYVYSYTNWTGMEWGTNRVYWNFGFGAAAGGKFLTKNGFIGELSFGVGRFLKKYNEGIEAYPRMGITIGKRF